MPYLTAVKLSYPNRKYRQLFPEGVAQVPYFYGAEFNDLLNVLCYNGMKHEDEFGSYYKLNYRYDVFKFGRNYIKLKKRIFV